MIRRPKKKVSLTGETFGYIHVGKEYDYFDENDNEIREYDCYCSACSKTVRMSQKKLFMARWHVNKENKMPSCGCLKYQGFVQHNKSNNPDLTGTRFDRLFVLERGPVIEVGSHNKKRQTWKCLCDCGEVCFVTTGDLISGNNRSCGCIVSKYESIIASLLRENNIAYKRQYSFADLVSKNNVPLRFDFALFIDGKLVGLLEYQGEQHYAIGDSWFGKREREDTDLLKKQYCIANDIKLYEIKHTDNIELKLNEIIQVIHDNTVPSLDDASKKV